MREKLRKITIKSLVYVEINYTAEVFGSSLFSSLEDRKQRPTLLLQINRRKVEAFIHSVIILQWPLCLQQLSTSDYYFFFFHA